MAIVQDIYNEIDRIENAKSGIAEAIEEKGVEVPEGTMIQDFPAKVRQIQQGSPDAVLFTPQDLTPEQQAQARQNIGAGTYTKPNTGIPATDFAQGVQTSLEKANTAVQPDALTPITDLIPEQATPQNQLADKNFVNSSVATNTANYISDNGQPFQSVADLEAYTGTLTNNDYAFVVGTDSAGNTTYTRYKYNATTQTWAEEYVLNNSSFTAEQWAAISSGITALLVQKLSELPTEIVTYVAQTLTEAQKQQARTNIGATAPEIFWAVYGETTVAELDTAIAANKVVFLVRNNYVYRRIKTENDFYCFAATCGGRTYNAKCNRNNGAWTAPADFIIENTANKSQSVPTDRESTTKYPSVKAVFDSLYKWGIVSHTIVWQGTNDDGYTHTVSNQVWGAVQIAHILMFERAGAVFNETTGYFELNEILDISYNEMLDIYVASIGGLPFDINRNSQFNNYQYRTTVAIRFYSGYSTSINHLFVFATYLEVANLSGCNNLSTVINSFQGCRRLRKIIGEMAAQNWNDTVFENCASLEYLHIRRLRSNLALKKSSHIQLESIVFIVNYAENTTEITITLHATAYARCVADTTEYTYNGQTYTGIIAYAAAKNITIASA